MKTSTGGGTVSQRDMYCPCSIRSPTMPAEDNSQAEEGVFCKKGHRPVFPMGMHLPAHGINPLEQADSSSVLTSTIS